MMVMVKGWKNGPFEISAGVKVLDYEAKSTPMPASLSLSLRSIKEQTYRDGNHTVLDVKSEEIAG